LDIDVVPLGNDGWILPAMRVEQRWHVSNKILVISNNSTSKERRLYVFDSNMKLLTVQPLLGLYYLALLVVGLVGLVGV